jgi:hypothetical protein
MSNINRAALVKVNTEDNDSSGDESESNKSSKDELSLGDIKRKPGRPRGSKAVGYIRKSIKWEPKVWRPIHEQIVYQHVLGKSNTEIAAEIGYTDQQVSNILNCTKGKQVKESLLEKGRSHFITETEKDQEAMVVAANGIIKKVLTNEDWVNKAPLAMFDRSIAYLKAVGKMTGDKIENKTQNNIFIGADVAKVLSDGLAAANEVIKRHSK